MFIESAGTEEVSPGIMLDCDSEGRLIVTSLREVEQGMVGFVNVKTDYRARAPTVRFSSGET